MSTSAGPHDDTLVRTSIDIPRTVRCRLRRQPDRPASARQPDDGQPEHRRSHRARREAHRRAARQRSHTPTRGRRAPTAGHPRNNRATAEVGDHAVPAGRVGRSGQLVLWRRQRHKSHSDTRNARRPADVVVLTALCGPRGARRWLWPPLRRRRRLESTFSGHLRGCRGRVAGCRVSSGS